MPSVKKSVKPITLEQAIESVKSEITIKDDGIGYCSIRGAARLANVDQSGLSKSLKLSEDFFASKLAENLIRQGFKGEDFSEKGIPDLALGIILTYYGYQAGARCTELAQQCCLAFITMGIRTWIQKIAGWKSEVEVRSDALKKADSAISVLKEVQTMHPVTYQMALQSLEINQNALELADTSSLVANRLGLAFNKQLKAFEAIQDATSPEAFDSLREAYYKLAEQHAELLKLKTQPPTIEYVEKPVVKTEYVERIVEKIVEVPSGNSLVEFALRSENQDLKAENKDLQRQLNNIWEIYNKAQDISDSKFLLPSSKKK